MAKRTVTRPAHKNATAKEAAAAQAHMEENGMPPSGYGWNPHADTEAGRWVKFDGAADLDEIADEIAAETTGGATA